jgi:hypothetical protein
MGANRLVLGIDGHHCGRRAERLRSPGVLRFSEAR